MCGLREPGKGTETGSERLPTRSLRREAAGRGWAAAPQGGRDGCRETGLPRPRLQTPVGAGRAQRPRPPPARRALWPPPAARDAPLTRRPAARGRREPALGAAGRPPSGRPTKRARPPAPRGRKSAGGPARGASCAALGAPGWAAFRWCELPARRGDVGTWVAAGPGELDFTLRARAPGARPVCQMQVVSRTSVSHKAGRTGGAFRPQEARVP